MTLNIAGSPKPSRKPASQQLLRLGTAIRKPRPCCGRLAAGLSLEDAASSLDISRNTARAHLRSIFSKSGITRQTELVRLMLNSAVVLGERPRQVA